MSTAAGASGAPALRVWGRRTSSNVQALMWAIGELGLPCELTQVGHGFGGTDTADFAALNPNRTVPVLQDGTDPPLWETGAILRYLAGRYAPESFWPADPLRRADVDRWAEWAKINVAMGFTVPVFWRAVRTPPDRRDPQAITRALAALEDKLALAEARLGTTAFLAGDDLTLADIQLGHVLWRYYDIDIPRRPLPHLAAYSRRLAERPAYRAHVMVPYDTLRGDLPPG